MSKDYTKNGEEIPGPFATVGLNIYLRWSDLVPGTYEFELIQYLKAITTRFGNGGYTTYAAINQGKNTICNMDIGTPVKLKISLRSFQNALYATDIQMRKLVMPPYAQPDDTLYVKFYKKNDKLMRIIDMRRMQTTDEMKQLAETIMRY